MLDVEKSLQKLKKGTSCTYNSTCVIAVCYLKEGCWCRPFDNKLSGDVDASIACTFMMLEATELEVESVWVMWFDNEKMKEEFDIPSYMEDSSLLVLGYPTDTPTAKARWVLIYIHFQIYSKAYKTNKFL